MDEGVEAVDLETPEGVLREIVALLRADYDPREDLEALLPVADHVLRVRVQRGCEGGCYVVHVTTTMYRVLHMEHCGHSTRAKQKREATDEDMEQCIEGHLARMPGLKDWTNRAPGWHTLPRICGQCEEDVFAEWAARAG